MIHSKNTCPLLPVQPRDALDITKHFRGTAQPTSYAGKRPEPFPVSPNVYRNQTGSNLAPLYSQPMQLIPPRTAGMQQFKRTVDPFAGIDAAWQGPTNVETNPFGEVRQNNSIPQNWYSQPREER